MKEVKAAIYHFTDRSAIRPIVYQKEVERLKQFASKLGYSDAEVYVDKSLKKRDQIHLRNLLNNSAEYQALIMKDFYHIKSNTGSFMDDLIALGKQGVDVFTIEDGSFQFDKAPFEQPLKVAIYYCGLEIVGRSIELQLEIMRCFIRTCTNWQLIDEYTDTAGNKVDSSQKEIWELVKNRHKYDIVLVQSFNDIHWRTAKFCKMRHHLQTDIYSMHEDVYLKYEIGGNYEE